MSNGNANADLLRLWSEIRTDWEPGLTESEISAAESRWAFRFPPDLRALLSARLPVGPGFPNWRSGELVRLEQYAGGRARTTFIEEVLTAPLDGLLFDLEHNELWRRTWGPKPDRLEDAALGLRKCYSQAPALIPVFAHRYIPDRPSTPGDPVFSVAQSDIIVYGEHLRAYLHAEFLGGWASPSGSPRTIEFWSDFLS